jgi:chromate transporter
VQQRVSLASIAAVHAKIGLQSFGGGMSGLFFQQVVLKQGWMSEEEFLSGLAVSQILPGVNVTNLAVYIGYNLRGLAGAAVAFTGLLIFPFFIVIGCGLVYERLISFGWVTPALDGITAAAIGLLLMLVLRGARQAGNRGIGSILVLAATAIGVGVLRLPLLLVVAVMVPVSIGLAWQRKRGLV